MNLPAFILVLFSLFDLVMPQVTSGLAQIATAVYSSSFPTTLPNETYAFAQLLSAVRGSGINSATACIQKNLWIPSAPPVDNAVVCSYVTWIFSWTVAAIALAFFILLFGVGE